MKTAGSLYQAVVPNDNWNVGDTILILGLVDRMPQHVVIVTPDGKVRYGYHLDNFRKLTVEEM